MPSDDAPLFDFDGESFERDLDGKRLGAQYVRVIRLMSDGRWRTLQQIWDATGAPPQSASARLRDARKPKFGGHQMDRRRVGDPKDGLFEYRIILRGKAHAMA